VLTLTASYKTDVIRSENSVQYSLAKAVMLRSCPNIQLSGDKLPVSLTYGNTGYTCSLRTAIVYLLT